MTIFFYSVSGNVEAASVPRKPRTVKTFRNIKVHAGFITMRCFRSPLATGIVLHIYLLDYHHSSNSSYKLHFYYRSIPRLTPGWYRQIDEHPVGKYRHAWISTVVIVTTLNPHYIITEDINFRTQSLYFNGDKSCLAHSFTLNYLKIGTQHTITYTVFNIRFSQLVKNKQHQQKNILFPVQIFEGPFYYWSCFFHEFYHQLKFGWTFLLHSVWYFQPVLRYNAVTVLLCKVQISESFDYCRSWRLHCQPISIFFICINERAIKV